MKMNPAPHRIVVPSISPSSPILLTFYLRKRHHQVMWNSPQFINK